MLLCKSLESSGVTTEKGDWKNAVNVTSKGYLRLTQIARWLGAPKFYWCLKTDIRVATSSNATPSLRAISKSAASCSIAANSSVIYTTTDAFLSVDSEVLATAKPNCLLPQSNCT